MIPPDFIDDVLSRTDIVEIIEPRVALKKTGQNYSGLCPFHTEKSPSFSVSQEKQFYYCFGCQASGSALKFLMEFERMDFVSAVETLAGRLGMEVPQQGHGASAEVTRRRKSIYEMLDQASHFFQTQLKSHPDRDVAVNYFKDRGLSGVIARDFNLGYAPAGWDNLMKALIKRNEDRELLLDAGLIVEQKEEDKTYDRFRDRVMFPIRDLRGRTIAFGGRIIGDGKPKYLNSPETAVFHKGRELYGLYEARKAPGKLSSVIVVEGYMDVVALAQHGVTNAVATLGTATSADHIDRLYRMVPNIVFCFDGDNAGRGAAWKALLSSLPFLQDGRSVRFLFLPDGEDPDSLVRGEGAEGFNARLEKATPFTTFFFSHLAADIGLPAESIEGKAALANAAKPHLAKLPRGVFRQLVTKELEERTGVTLTQDRGTGHRSPPAGNPPERHQQASVATRASQSGTQALAILVQHPEVAAEFTEADYEKLGHVDEVLGAVALSILREDLSSPGLLMEHFQGTPLFGQIREAFTREQLLGADAQRDEFSGLVGQQLRKFDSQLKQQLIENLLDKPPSQLTEAERQLLKESYSSTNKL